MHLLYPMKRIIGCGQKTDWSYYDHPPLSSWVNFGFMSLLRINNFRSNTPFVCFIIILIVNIKWVRDIGLIS